MIANLPDLSVGTTTISPFLTLSVSDLSPLSCFLDKLLGCFPPFLHFSFKNFLNSAKACTLNVSILASVSKFFDLFGKITLALPFRSVVLLLLRFIERFSGSNTSLDLASSICFSSSISALIFWFSSSVKSDSIFLYASSSGFSASPPSLIISHRSFITHSSTSHRNISSHSLFLTLNFGPSERRSFSSSLILISSSSSNLTRQGTYSSIFSCSYSSAKILAPPYFNLSTLASSSIVSLFIPYFLIRNINFLLFFCLTFDLRAWQLTLT